MNSEEITLRPEEYVVDRMFWEPEISLENKINNKIIEISKTCGEEPKIKNENKINWEEELRIEFQCQICLNYMYPPIQQCETGHCFCKDCFERMVNCPACESPLNDTRNFALEHIFEKLTFPCKYTDDGCSFFAMGPTVKIHEKNCDYIEVRCPISADGHCGWIGNRFTIENHLEEEHKQRIVFHDYCEQIVHNFSVSCRVERMTMFYVHGEVFIFSNILTNGYFKATVYQLTQYSNETFKYEVTFNDKDSNDEMITVECPTKIVKPNAWCSITSDYKSYFSWVVTYLKQFVNEDDELRLNISIKKKKQK